MSALEISTNCEAAAAELVGGSRPSVAAPRSHRLPWRRIEHHWAKGVAVGLTERWDRGELQTLSSAECLQLLGSRDLGRMAYNDPDGPVVIPVNFVLDGDTVIIATSPHTDLGRHAHAGTVAFQVDEVDQQAHSGWSVLLRGTVEAVEYAELPASYHSRPAPWAGGVRTRYLRIVPSNITGRRLLPP